MNPKISKDLKKASEELQAKMLVMQDAESRMLALKTAFISAAKYPAKQAAIKPKLIEMHKELKAAEAAAEKADAAFHRILSTEPEEVYDLLDHKIQEHVVRTKVRKIVKESIKSLTTKKGFK